MYGEWGESDRYGGAWGVYVGDRGFSNDRCLGGDGAFGGALGRRPNEHNRGVITLLDHSSHSSLESLVVGVVLDPLHDSLAAGLLKELLVLGVLNI